MQTITPDEVAVRLNKEKVLHIIDVREAAEAAEGKIPGALNIPLRLLEFRKQDLDKRHEYILVCRSGARSGQAAQFLLDQGFMVKNMKGGMLAWAGMLE